MRARILGCILAFNPITKKVALTFFNFRTSSNLGVKLECGPSSKVRNTYFSFVVKELMAFLDDIWANEYETLATMNIARSEPANDGIRKFVKNNN